MNPITEQGKKVHHAHDAVTVGTNHAEKYEPLWNIDSGAGPQTGRLQRETKAQPRADPIGSISFSKVNDPKGIRTPVFRMKT